MKYALSGILFCGCCGSQYKRITWYQKGLKKIVWRCATRREFGKKYCKDSPSLEESVLHRTVLNAINLYAGGREQFISIFQRNLEIALQGQDDGFDVVAIKRRLQELEDLTLKLVEAAEGSLTAAARLESKFEELWNETQEQRALLKQHEEKLIAAGEIEKRLDEISRTLETESLDLTEFDDRLVRYFVEAIKVNSVDQILIIFKDGTEIVQKLAPEN